MSTGKPVPDEVRDAAIADFMSGTEMVKTVAARHGIPRSTLSQWLRRAQEDLAYVGGWEVRGGIQRPKMPERRSA